MNNILIYICLYCLTTIVSFLASLIAALFMYALFLPPGADSAADGLWFVVFIMPTALFFWTGLTILSPFFVEKHIMGNYAELKRLGVYLVTIPMIVMFISWVFTFIVFSFLM